MRKSFELFDDALEASVFEDLDLLSPDASAAAVAALPRSTGWWLSDTSATVHIPSFANGELTNEVLSGAAWAGLFCSLAEPVRSLSLSAKPNAGGVVSPDNTFVVPLWRNRLVLFATASLNAAVVPSPEYGGAGLWLICASNASGEAS